MREFLRTVIAKARAPAPRRFDRRLLARLRRQLTLAEEVLAAAEASSRGRPGVLAATNRRLVFVRGRLLRRRAESIAYGEVRGVRSTPGRLTLDLERGQTRSFALPRVDSAIEIGALADARVDATRGRSTRLLADVEALARDRQLQAQAREEPADDLVDLEPPTAEIGVLEWRHQRLIAAGYDSEDAATLAGSEADLEQACALLEHGCEPAVAMRILV